MPVFTNGTFGRFGTFGTLGTPGTPSTSVTPVTPVTPVTLVTPVTPITPDTPSTPGTPSSVGTAGTAGTGGTAGVTGSLPQPPGEAWLNPANSAPGDDPRRFTAARVPAPKVVVYIPNDGTELIREGGSRSWRNHNPGNIQKGSFADANGTIGGDSRFAIFPDESTGREAIVTLLRGASYRDLTLANAINRYAPPHENNTQGYVAFVADQTELDPGTVLSGWNVTEIRSIANAIKKIEGWTPGSERENAPFAGGAGGPPAPMVSAAGAASDWMGVANGEASLPESERSEWPDPGENPRILRYFEVACPWFDPNAGDEVDWCAAFVNYCLETAGYSGSSHPGARSFFWNKQNRFLKVDQPSFGSIAVFRKKPFDDPTWESGPGHVGFLTSWTEDHITLLGGNQDNTVKTKTYAKTKRDENDAVIRELAGFYIPVMN